MPNETKASETAGTAETKSGFSITRLLPLAVIGAGIAAFFALGLDQYLSFEALRENRQALNDWYAGNQVVAIATFIGIYALATALSVPGALFLTLGGGFIFGTVVGTAAVVVGATVGAAGIFLAARYALRDFFEQKAGAMVKKMEAGFQENAFSYLLVLRLVPLFPFWLVNLVPAFLGVPLRTFVIGTFLGIIPGTAVYSSVGNGLGAIFDQGGTPDLGIIFQPEILGPILGLAVLSLVPVIYKRFKKS